MLKKRIIPIELFMNGRLCKTTKFKSPRDVGDPVKSSQVYSDQDADELLFLNISRSERSVNQIITIVTEIAQNCFVPFSVGGGIKTPNDAADLFAAGADKVLINSISYTNLEYITEIANIHGKQAVTIGIDVRKNDSNEYKLFSNCGENLESISLDDHLKSIIAAGAGEILIQSIDLDGTMGGYDDDLIKFVVDNSSVPIIVAGGAGDFLHIKKAFDEGVDAAACGSLFNFGDNNPLRAKAFLKNHQIPLKKI
jgi:imidazole glycerol-phosphate synthase subunit HisF